MIKRVFVQTHPYGALASGRILVRMRLLAALFGFCQPPLQETGWHIPKETEMWLSCH